MDKLIDLNKVFLSIDQVLLRATPGNIAHTVGNARSGAQAGMAYVEELIGEAQEWEGFFADVLDMRRHQAAFFASPPGTIKSFNFKQSKHFEAKVDKFLKMRLSKQQKLPF